MQIIKTITDEINDVVIFKLVDTAVCGSEIVKCVVYGSSANAYLFILLNLLSPREK